MFSRILQIDLSSAETLCPPPCEHTHTTENITFPQLLWWTTTGVSCYTMVIIWVCLISLIFIINKWNLTAEDLTFRNQLYKRPDNHCTKRNFVLVFLYSINILLFYIVLCTKYKIKWFQIQFARSLSALNLVLYYSSFFSPMN